MTDSVLDAFKSLNKEELESVLTKYLAEKCGCYAELCSMAPDCEADISLVDVGEIAFKVKRFGYRRISFQNRLTRESSYCYLLIWRILYTIKKRFALAKRLPEATTRMSWPSLILRYSIGSIFATRPITTDIRGLYALSP